VRGSKVVRRKALPLVNARAAKGTVEMMGEASTHHNLIYRHIPSSWIFFVRSQFKSTTKPEKAD
jgi:hypothetical protein